MGRRGRSSGCLGGEEGEGFCLGEAGGGVGDARRSGSEDGHGLVLGGGFVEGEGGAGVDDMVYRSRDGERRRACGQSV